MRIVSLLGSATEIVYHLGLERHLVGISHECDYPPPVTRLPRLSRPRFDPAEMTSGEVDAAVRRCMEEHGSVYVIDRATLAELRPTIVLTQAVCEVCAVPTSSVEEAVAALNAKVAVVSLDAHSIEGIFSTIHQVAEAAGAVELGVAAEARLRDRIEYVASRVAEARRPTVLTLEWLDPPFAPGHWVPEMIEMAGGLNLAGEAGKRSSQIEWPALSDLDPDVLLVEPCGYDLARATADADQHRQRLLGVASGAIGAGRAWVLHSAWFSRSGPRVVEGIETLAQILHPALFPEPPRSEIARPYR